MRLFIFATLILFSFHIQAQTCDEVFKSRRWSAKIVEFPNKVSTSVYADSIPFLLEEFQKLRAKIETLKRNSIGFSQEDLWGLHYLYETRMGAVQAFRRNADEVSKEDLIAIQEAAFELERDANPFFQKFIDRGWTLAESLAIKKVSERYAGLYKQLRNLTPNSKNAKNSLQFFKTLNELLEKLISSDEKESLDFEDFYIFLSETEKLTRSDNFVYFLSKLKPLQAADIRREILRFIRQSRTLQGQPIFHLVP